MPSSTAIEITEARTLPTSSKGPRELDIQLIDPGWGSSGYYSAEVLEAAAKNRVFKAGTHMYIDHPTATEDDERPGRSVRDLAATLIEDAYVDTGGGLRARAKPLNGWGTPLAEMKDAIGVSIRAGAYATEGEAEGRRGPLVDELIEAKSVDFVTKAGRGGKILEVLESARPRAVYEAHGMTANDLRDAINTAVRDAHKGKDTWAYLRDYSDDWVVYELYVSGKGEKLYQRAYTVTDGLVTLTGDPAEVKTHTSYIPADAPAPPLVPAVASTESATPVVLPTGLLATHPPGTTTDPVQVAEAVHTAVTTPPSVTAGAPPPAPTPESVEESMTTPQTGGPPPASAAGPAEVTEAARIPVSEAAQLQRLLEESQAHTGKALARAELAEAERDTAVRRATLVEAKWAAETRTKTALATSPLKEASYSSVIADVCNGLSLDEHGKVDDTLVEAAIKAAIDKEATKVAALLEAHGVGAPRGLGGSAGQPSQLSEAAFEEQFSKLLVASGADEKSAKLAAEGRG